MVAHLGLRTHELLYEEIGNSIAEMVSVWEVAIEVAECYKEVANHSQRIFALFQNNEFWFFPTLYKTSKNYYLTLNF